MLEGELSDPRIAPSYVTDVVLAPGGKSARIFIAVHGDEQEEDEADGGTAVAEERLHAVTRLPCAGRRRGTRGQRAG